MVAKWNLTRAWEYRGMLESLWARSRAHKDRDVRGLQQRPPDHGEPRRAGRGTKASKELGLGPGTDFSALPLTPALRGLHACWQGHRHLHCGHSQFCDSSRMSWGRAPCSNLSRNTKSAPPCPQSGAVGAVVFPVLRPNLSLFTWQLRDLEHITQPVCISASFSVR